MEAATHTGFIIAAYATAFVVVGGLIGVGDARLPGAAAQHRRSRETGRHPPLVGGGLHAGDATGEGRRVTGNRKEQRRNANIGGRRIIVLAPLVVFLGLVILFLFRLYSGDPSRIPSALIGHPAP